MADIELVIKIDEKYLEYIHKAVEVDCTAPPYFAVESLWESALNGTPLPKGHGRIGDLDALREEVSSWGMNDYEPSDFTDEIDRADTIIEADRERRRMTREEAREFIAQSVKSDVDMAKIADALKALEQEPRKGHWIGHREHCENLGVMPSGLGCYEWCSNCDCGIDVREWHRNNYNFCPNCGADMREVEE